MTILAGIFCRRWDGFIRDEACSEIARTISRKPDYDVSMFRDQRVFLAKVDIGAYGKAPIRMDGDGTASMVAGEPLLAHNSGGVHRPRSQDLETLHSNLKRGKWDVLTDARGSYCAVHYDAIHSSLTLISDKLCIRPLYYWMNNDYVMFATALRILENSSMVTKIMDLEAVIEITTLGYPLGTRTPYVNTYLLEAGQTIHFHNQKITRQHYFKWDQAVSEASTSHIDVLLDEAYKRFTLAVEQRLGTDTATLAFLSGGLDSRCVVAALKKKNAQVFTFNFSDPETQDRVFARAFSNAVGTTHIEGPLGIDPDMSKKISTALSESKNRFEPTVERPRLIWSGDGGSVGVGHVYLTEKIVDLMRQGSHAVAIDVFIQNQGATLIKGLFNQSLLKVISQMPATGIQEELKKIQCEDPARSFYLFLMLNDQRRHLARHFESIDVNGIEFHLPFFDAHFLESILHFPLDFCLRHHLYLKWLIRFPEKVLSVPWQVYPGHEAPPMKAIEGAAQQWDSEYQKERGKIRKKEFLTTAFSMLSSDRFPHHIINKRNLLLATWVYRMGFRDYSYLTNAATVIMRYWTICDGRYSI